MKTILFAFAFLFSFTLFSQTTISGKIVNEKGVPIAGANVYIEGSYDGASSSENGDFVFATTTTGNQNTGAWKPQILSGSRKSKIKSQTQADVCGSQP